MKTTNKIIAVSILAMLAVPAAHAKIVAETMLSEESGHYSSTHTVQSEINAKQDTAKMVTSTSGYNTDIADATKYPNMPVVNQMISDTQVGLTSRVTSLESGKVNVAQGSGAASKAVITDSSGNVTTGTIATDMIEGKAVTAAKIADSTITSTQLANNAVTTAKITDANVTKAKLASDVQTSLGKADTALQAADITGKVDVAQGSGAASKAVITDSSGNVTTGTIATDMIEGKAVTAAKIADSTITSTQLANNAVVTAKIKDANVTKAKLASAVQASLDKADSALQAADITGKQDIQIGAAKVSGEDSIDKGKAVVVDADGKISMSTKKLGSAAYTDSTAYDAAGAAAAVENKLDDGASGYDINAKSLKVQGTNVLTSLNGAVLTTGTQTVGGAKTFSGAATFSSSATFNGTTKVSGANTTAGKASDGTTAVAAVSDGDVKKAVLALDSKKEEYANKSKAATAVADSTDNTKKDVNYPTVAGAKAIADAAVSGAADNYAAKVHTHVASDVTKMTGYSKASAASAISATDDSLNTAIGKLEYKVDQATTTANGALKSVTANSADGVVTNVAKSGTAVTMTKSKVTNAMVDDSAAITTNKMGAITGYTKASTNANLATTDTLNTALGKLEKKADDAATAAANAGSAVEGLDMASGDTTGTGNVITSINQVNGKVTAVKGMIAVPEPEDTTTTGTLVLTAKPKTSGTGYDYFWEDLGR